VRVQPVSGRWRTYWIRSSSPGSPTPTPTRPGAITHDSDRADTSNKGLRHLLGEEWDRQYENAFCVRLCAPERKINGPNAGGGGTQSIARRRNEGQAEVSRSDREFERAAQPRRRSESQLHPRATLLAFPPRRTMTVLAGQATDPNTSTDPSALQVSIPTT
jgi:hypothetical protein